MRRRDSAEVTPPPLAGIVLEKGKTWRSLLQQEKHRSLELASNENSLLQEEKKRKTKQKKQDTSKRNKQQEQEQQHQEHEQQNEYQQASGKQQEQQHQKQQTQRKQHQEQDTHHSRQQLQHEQEQRQPLQQDHSQQQKQLEQEKQKQLPQQQEQQKKQPEQHKHEEQLQEQQGDSQHGPGLLENREHQQIEVPSNAWRSLEATQRMGSPERASPRLAENAADLCGGLDEPEEFLGPALEEPLRLHEELGEEGDEDLRVQLARRRRQLQEKLFCPSSKRKRPRAWEDPWMQPPAGFVKAEPSLRAKRELFSVPIVKREPKPTAAVPAPKAADVLVAPAKSAESAPSLPADPPLAAASEAAAGVAEKPKDPLQDSRSPSGLLKRRRRGVDPDGDESKETNSAIGAIGASSPLTPGSRILKGLPRADLLRMAGQLERRYLGPVHVASA